MKHLHKLIPLGVVLFLAVAFVIVLQVVGSEDINKPKTVLVKTVKVTKTYLDWKNSPTDTSLGFTGRAMKLADIPANSEVTVHGFYIQSFDPPFSDRGRAANFVLGNLGALRADCRGNAGFIGGIEPSFGSSLCYGNDPLGLFAVHDKNEVDALTQGSLDVFISYIVH